VSARLLDVLTTVAPASILGLVIGAGVSRLLLTGGGGDVRLFFAAVTGRNRTGEGFLHSRAPSLAATMSGGVGGSRIGDSVVGSVAATASDVGGLPAVCGARGAEPFRGLREEGRFLGEERGETVVCCSRCDECGEMLGEGVDLAGIFSCNEGGGVASGVILRGDSEEDGKHSIEGDSDCTASSDPVGDGADDDDEAE